MKKIPLGRSMFALVNNADFKWLSQWSWNVSGDSKSGYYATRKTGPSRKPIYMHVEIVKPARGKQADHKNGDTLDNRRRNLRECSVAQNQWNAKIRKDNKSGFRGVCWHAVMKSWCAWISVHPRRIFLGYFQTARAAGSAYKQAAKRYHGAFAKI